MNWKKFLKPGWGKILFAVLMSIGSFSASPGETFIARVFMSPYLIFGRFFPYPVLEPYSIYWWFWFIGTLIYAFIFWYFILCLFGYIWNRFKKK